MAKQSSAYYSGLQRASQGVSLADFSVISKKVEQVAKEKAQEKVNKKKERDQLQLKMLELYGPEIYSGFDNVGLDNVDMVAGKISTKIKQVADANNALFNEGSISEGEYATRMAKMIGQSRKVAKDFSKISGYVDTVREKGDDASLTSRKNLESLNNLYSFAGVDMDESMNLSFFTQGEDEDGNSRVEVTPFDKFGKFTEYRDAFDFNEVSRNIFSVDKEANQFFKGGTVLKSFRDRGGNFTPEQNNYIENYAKETLYNDPDELYDAASRAGIKFTTDSFGKIKDYDRVFKETTDYLKEKVKSDYLLRESEDEGAYRDLDLKTKALNLRYQQERRRKGEKTKSQVFNYSPEMASQYTNIFGQEGVGFMEHVMKDDKDKFVSALPNFIDILAPTLSGPLTKDEDKSAFSTIKGGIIQSLWEHPSGQHGVVVTVPNEIGERYLVDDVEKVKWKGVSNTYFFPIQSNTQANILRAKFDLGDMNPEQKKYWTSTAQANQAPVTGELD